MYCVNISHVYTQGSHHTFGPGARAQHDRVAANGLQIKCGSPLCCSCVILMKTQNLRIMKLQTYASTYQLKYLPNAHPKGASDETHYIQTFRQAIMVKQDWMTMEFRFLQFRMHRYPLLHSNGQSPGVPRAQEERKTITIPTSSNCPCNSSIVFWCNKIHGGSP